MHIKVACWLYATPEDRKKVWALIRGSIITFVAVGAGFSYLVYKNKKVNAVASS